MSEYLTAGGIHTVSPPSDDWQAHIDEPDDYLLPIPGHIHCEGPPQKCIFFAERATETLCRHCRDERLKRDGIDWIEYARGSQV